MWCKTTENYLSGNFLGGKLVFFNFFLGRWSMLLYANALKRVHSGRKRDLSRNFFCNKRGQQFALY